MINYNKYFKFRKLISPMYGVLFWIDLTSKFTFKIDKRQQWTAVNTFATELTTKYVVVVFIVYSVLIAGRCLVKPYFGL